MRDSESDQNDPNESLPKPDSPVAEKPPHVPQPRVFGPWANWIVLIPFVVYLGGMMFGGYLEKTRLRMSVDHDVKVLKDYLTDSSLLPDIPGEAPVEKPGRVRQWMKLQGPEKEEEWERKFDWPAIEDAMYHVEDHDFEPLKKASAVFLQDLPELKDPPFVELREVVKRFYRNLEIMEKGEEGVEPLADEDAGEANPEEAAEWFPANRNWYPTTYTIVIALTSLFVLFAFPGYFRAPFCISWLGFLFGVLGFFVWIALWYLDRHYLGLAEMIGGIGSRPAFNPFEHLKHDPSWMRQFLAIRFAGLVLIVPLVEEFFIRGWLMRYIDSPDWDEIPLGEATWKAIVGVAVYAAISHTAEPLAAVVWFSMGTWLYLKTKSIWDCVIMHAVTNLMLGIFVIKTGIWELW